MSYFRQKCTKFDFRWGSAPDPAEGAYSAPPDTYLDSRGLLLGERREGKGWKGEDVWEREEGQDGWEREGGERKGKRSVPANKHLQLHPAQGVF